MKVSYDDIRGIVELVIKDLTALGHERIFTNDSQMDTSNLCTNEVIICARGGSEDYHFMRYTADGWLHKPANSQILRYLYTPTDGKPWNNEALYRDSYEEYSITYEGLIIFISYNGHNWSYANSHNMTHTKSCSICDDVFQENCQLSYDTYLGDSLHNGRCNACHYVINGVYCTYSYASNDNGTHKRTCTLSDHETTNVSCSYIYSTAENGTHVATCRFCNYSVVRGCTLVSEYSGNGMHHSECTVCAGSYDEACTAVMTYCGDDTLGDVHALACEDCGNPMGTTTEGCTLEYIFTGTIDGNNVHTQICTECKYKKVEHQRCFYNKNNICIHCGQAGDIQAGDIWKVEDPVE